VNQWIILLVQLATDQGAVRQRLWRHIKSEGAATLRDGVYLLPALEPCRAFFETMQQEIQQAGGMAMLLPVEPPAGVEFSAYFDRRREYAQLLDAIKDTHSRLEPKQLNVFLKQTRKWRKNFQALAAIDYFAGDAAVQAQQGLEALEKAVHTLSSPQEPTATSGDVTKHEIREFTGRQWVSRSRPWADRLASAWLIKKFIDVEAEFLWLSDPKQSPDSAVGFDFDGATFSHLGPWVTFEVLLRSFSLTMPALQRLGHLVHSLDLGGAQPKEAAGLSAVLTGLQQVHREDAELLKATFPIFDALFLAMHTPD
jgi:hypothetical protein